MRVASSLAFTGEVRVAMWVSGTELADVVGESEPETDESAREPAAAAAAAAESARQPAATKPECEVVVAKLWPTTREQ